jgi:acyl transferase domain-containing protein
MADASGRDDVEAFWSMLRDGVEAITRFERDALIAAGNDPRVVADPATCRPTHAHRHRRFDAASSAIRRASRRDDPSTAASELAWGPWRTPAMGGYETGRRRVCRGGVNAYASTTFCRPPGGDGDADLFQLMIGNDKDFAPTRIAYKGLEGPAVSVNPRARPR